MKKISTSLLITLLAVVIIAPMGSVAYAKNDNNNGGGQQQQNNDDYDKDGYDKNGYDRDGYGKDGYDRNGRDHDGHGRGDKGDDKNGYGGKKVEVCRETGSRFFPYTKVTVPKATAEKWVSKGDAVYPNAQGKCPKPEKTLRQYIKERIEKIFDRWFR